MGIKKEILPKPTERDGYIGCAMFIGTLIVLIGIALFLK